MVKVPNVEEMRGETGGEFAGGRRMGEDRGEEGWGKGSEERRGGGTLDKILVGGAVSLKEEETESQLERREEERRENSALNCHRSLKQTQNGQLNSVSQLKSGPSTHKRLVNYKQDNQQKKVKKKTVWSTKNRFVKSDLVRRLNFNEAGRAKACSTYSRIISC